MVDWVVDLESVLSLTCIQLLDLVLVWLVDGDGQVVELLHVGFEWHPEYAVILFGEADLLFPLIGPGRVVISPWTLVLFQCPWITKLGNGMHCLIFLVLEFLDFKECVGVAGDEAVNGATSAAAGCHWVVL